MKNTILLLAAGCYSLSALAQDKPVKRYTTDRDLSRWVIDINMLGGIYDQKMEMAPTTTNYLNGINVNPGTPGFNKGTAIGGDLQLGLFMGRNKHWGLGTGILYLRQQGDITLNDYHAEYQSVDGNGFTFRQVVSANNIEEQLRIDNFNIPVLLKYKNRFSKRWGFTADAGVLFNIKTKTTYTTNASFDYEAIYKFQNNEGGTATPIYETSVIPGDGAFLITKDHFTKNNPDGSVNDYFNEKRAAGYHVGLGVTPDEQTGEIAYNKASVAFLLQPSVNYFFSDKVALNLGVFYMYHPHQNEANTSYTMTGRPGEYSAISNSVSKMQAHSYGANVGLRFFLGKPARQIAITNTNSYNPTACGLCDGSFELHGLKHGDQALVSYHVNGAASPGTYSGTVNNKGAVTITGLCEGSYTNIKTTVGKSSANSESVHLVAPKLVISRVASNNPTGQGTCDGSMVFYGLTPGQQATVTYTKDGVAGSYAGRVAGDQSLTLPALCSGTFTDMEIVSNKCTAKVNNPASVLLKDPQPPVVVVVEEPDTMTQVMFEFNMSEIRPSAYPVIDRVLKQLQDDKLAYVVIDGNTDIIGSADYNQALSERRAAAVKAYLMNAGIEESRIRNRGNGEREPVAPNETAEGRSLNRRAELQIRIR